MKETKKIKILSVVLVFFAMFLPFATKATGEFKDTKISYIKKQKNGEYCIDLDEVYKYVNNESKVFTEAENSVDASKKANSISTLVNISTILGGNNGFCIKDKKAATNAGLLKSNGILGLINETNISMMAYFPTVNVVDHLAQTFVPGYEGNNSTLAQENTNSTPQCETSEKFCKYACDAYNMNVEPSLIEVACPGGMCADYTTATKNIPTKDDCLRKCQGPETKCKDEFINGYNFMTLAQMNTNFTEQENPPRGMRN